jgi:LmbE family N-acetylglucosaminyl deacetylase
MSVVVIAPHPDDEAIGCGGAIATRAANGERVDVVFMTSGELALAGREPEEAARVREREAGAAATVLGVSDLAFLRQRDFGLSGSVERAVDLLAPLLARLGPDTIYHPHPGEAHPDHQAAAAIAVWAGERAGLPRSALLGYEVWTPMPSYDVVQDIGAVMPRKLDAIRSYASQGDHFDYIRAATGLGQYRGAMAARCEYAEVFAQC